MLLSLECRSEVLLFPELVHILGKERGGQTVVEHLHSRVCSPARVHRLLDFRPTGLDSESRIVCRRKEEAGCNLPDILDEGSPLPYKGNHLCNVFTRNDMILEVNALAGELRPCSQCAGRTVHDIEAVRLKHRDEHPGHLLIGLGAEIFLIVPSGLVRIESCSGFDDTVERECPDELVHGEKFPVVARIPAEHGEHIDEGLREISVLTVASGLLAGSIDPLQRENREAETVTVTLAELALSVRLEKEGEMCKARHCILPAESLVEHIVERQ